MLDQRVLPSAYEGQIYLLRIGEIGMKSYWCADSVETKPDLTKLTSFGYPTDGNPEQGFEATLPGAAWFYLVSLMRSQIISACSKTEDPKLENQYLECLRSFDWALEKSIDGSKIKTATIDNDRIKQGVIAFDRLAAAAIANEQQAIAGTAKNLLMTPYLVAKAIAALIPPAMPTGMIFPWPGDTPPEGAIVADGRELNRTTYKGLFNIYGTKYGAGDGSTTFNVPDLDGRFIELTTDAGSVGQFVEPGLPNITGGLNIPNGSEVSGNNYFQTEGCFLYEGRTNPLRKGNTQNPGEGGRIAVSATMSSSIFGAATSVQPSSTLFLVCIKF